MRHRMESSWHDVRQHLEALTWPQECHPRSQKISPQGNGPGPNPKNGLMTSFCPAGLEQSKQVHSGFPMPGGFVMYGLLMTDDRQLSASLAAWALPPALQPSPLFLLPCTLGGLWKEELENVPRLIAF